MNEAVTVRGTNFGKAAGDYAAYRAGFPDSIFDRFKEFGIGEPGQSVVDLGTGTGTLARGFALRGCNVIGVDPDARMIAQAEELDRRESVSIRYVKAAAESTGLAQDSADVVSAGQCWHWFDRPKAIAEAKRILKPGGKLMIAHFDWLPLEGNMVEATERLIERYNADWHLGGGNGRYPQWLPDLRAAGMTVASTFSYDLDVPYTHEAWRGRIRASAGIAALGSRMADEFDAALAGILAARFPSKKLAVPHRIFGIVAAAS